MAAKILPIPEPSEFKQIAVMSLAEIVDEFGDRALEVEQFEPKAKRYKALKAAIDARFENHPAAQDAFALGQRWEVRLTAKRNESNWVSKVKVWKLLGGLKSLHLWDVSAKAVTAVLGADSIEDLRFKERTGYRTITAVLRGTAA